MKKFNEWLTDKNEDNFKSSDNLGMVISEDDALISNQLDQFVNRIFGILHNVSEEKRGSFVEKIITDLKNNR